MKLKNNLYKIISKEEVNSIFNYTVELNPSCVIYEAHFPGEPITPGVCIVQIGKEVIEDFSVTPSFDEIKEKSYSFSAGQYFDIKIEYVDITGEEFNARMASFRQTLIEQFAESHRLEKEIMRQLDNLKFNKQV